jgi:hypothetical protein
VSGHLDEVAEMALHEVWRQQVESGDLQILASVPTRNPRSEAGQDETFFGSIAAAATDAAHHADLKAVSLIGFQALGQNSRLAKVGY